MINKTVLILGCSSDIGIQTAHKFLKKKWNVIAHFNKSKKGVDILQKKYTNQIKLFKLDLSNPKSVMNFTSKKLVKFKRIDSFVSLTGYLMHVSNSNLKF